MENVSDPNASPDPWEFTGNHWLAAPWIARADGAVHGLNVIHRAIGGLVSWTGEREPSPSGQPLLSVRAGRAGAADRPQDLSWERVDRWIPRWRARAGAQLTVTATLCTPGNVEPPIRGGVLMIEVHNHGSEDADVEIALDGAWQYSLLTVATTRTLLGPNCLVRGTVADGVALEAAHGGTTVALAITADANASYRAALDAAPPTELESGEERVAINGELLRFEISRVLHVRAGRSATAAFHLGIALERDGALAMANHHAALGADELMRLARLDLSRLTRRTSDAAVTALLNRNLLYAYLSGVARAIDDDRLYLVRSRSPSHGACAVFDEREALLWLMPALSAADPFIAREALVRSFEQYSHRPGQRLRYLDGGVLEPGFCLDQFIAYAISLDQYVSATNDQPFLDEPLIQDVLRELDNVLFTRLDPEHFLCATELLPSGDKADHAFVAYDNAMVRRFAEVLPRLWRRRQGEPPPRFERAADEVAAAIWQRCTVEVDGMRVIGYMSDLRGNVMIYDDPAGSLRLLPHLGFCDPDDPIWSNTMELLHSVQYPLWLGQAAYPGLATRRRPHVAAFAAVCADLLTPRRDEAVQLLRSLDLEGGIAGVAYDPRTGRITDGPFSASLAGFLSWALLAEPASDPPGSRSRRGADAPVREEQRI